MRHVHAARLGLLCLGLLGLMPLSGCGSSDQDGTRVTRTEEDAIRKVEEAEGEKAELEAERKAAR